MRRIRLYIFREFLGPTFLGLGVYTVLFLLKLLFDLADLAIRKQVPLGLLGQLLLLSMPRLLAITVPMAVLVGILVGMGRLSSDGEITALRSSGISYLQMLVPALWLGGLAALLVGYFSLVLIPETSYAQHKLNGEILLSGDIGRGLKPGVFYQSIPDVLLYADQVDREGNLLGTLLVQKGPDGVQRLTLARRARITKEETGEIRFFLEDGETHAADVSDPELYERSRFDEEVLVRPPDPRLLDFAATLTNDLSRNHREMSTPALYGALRQTPGSPEAVSKSRRPQAQVELHRRFAVPLACILFALLGFPLGIVTRRGGRSSGFALSLLLVLAYWLVMTGAENLVVGGAIPAWAGAWSPNALFLVLVMVLLGWLSRDRRMPRIWQRWRARLAGETPGKAAAEPRRRRRAIANAGSFAGRLDQYIIHHYLRAFVLILASFYLLFFLADLRTLLDDISKHPDLTFSVVARYFGIVAPSMVLHGIPLAALFAALLSLGVLDRNNEVMAMKAAGVSLYRLSVPVLGMAALLCAGHFLVSETVLPAANTRAAELRAYIRNVEPASTFGPRQWVFGRDNRLYNFALYRQTHGEHGLTVYRLSANRTRLEERIEAKKAVYEAGAWVLEDGWVRGFANGAETFRSFAEARFELPEGPEYFRRGVRPPQQMTFARLRSYIHRVQQAGYDVQELQVALHEKTSLAAVPFVLVLIGLPYAFRAGRRGALSGAGLALALAVIFYVCLAVFRALGNAGFIPPILAAWSPDLLFTGVGIFQMLSLRT